MPLEKANAGALLGSAPSWSSLYGGEMRDLLQRQVTGYSFWTLKAVKDFCEMRDQPFNVR